MKFLGLVISGGVAGYVLGTVGVYPNRWEFWAIVTCIVLVQLFTSLSCQKSQGE